jgi:hypothetical protein
MSRYRRGQRKAPPDPEPWLRLLSLDLRDNPKSVAWAKTKLEHDQAQRDFNRRLVDNYNLHRACPLKARRRAHRCSGRELLCYEETLPLLRKYVFPKLHAALRERQAEAALRSESPSKL